MATHLIFTLLLCGSICNALVPDFPKATQIGQDPLFNPIGFSPKPTAAPKVPRELFYKRDFLSNSANFVLVAPDQTCGYVSGLPGANFECGDSTSCVFFPATGSAFGAVGCCTDILQCGFRTACVDSSSFYASGCNGGCQIDVYTMKCTASSAPYCASIRYAAPGATVQQYFCNAEQVSTWQTAFTTFSGQTVSRVFQTIQRAALESSAASASSSSSSSSKSAAKSSPTSSSTISSTTSSTSASSKSATAGPTGSSKGNGDKKSSDTGAIVGGLIGGAAVLGLIGAGAFLIYKRKYVRNNASPSHTPLNNLPQDGFHSPQNQPQPYMFQGQYHPVPVEMPSDYAQRSPGQAYEKPGVNPTSLSPNQHYMTPAAYNPPPSEIDSNPAHNR